MQHYDEALGTLASAAQEMQNWLTAHQYDADREAQRKNGGMLAGILQNLCFASLERQRETDAENTGREAVAVARQYSGADSPVLARALFGVSIVWYRKKDYATAREMLEEALKIFQAHKELKMTAFCLNNLARISEELGEKEKGVELHRKAVALRRDLPDKSDLAFSLGNLGVALATIGDWERAEAALSEALAIYRSLGMTDSREYKGYNYNLEICRKAKNKAE